MYFNRAAFSDRIDSFVRLGLEVHLIRCTSDDACQVGLDHLIVGSQLGAFANNCNVSICNFISRCPYSTHGLAEKRL